MGNSAPANSSLVPERPKGLLTSAECLKIVERKMGEAIGDRRYGEELRATAKAWLVLAGKIEQAEALEWLKANGKLTACDGVAASELRGTTPRPEPEAPARRQTWDRIRPLPTVSRQAYRAAFKPPHGCLSAGNYPYDDRIVYRGAAIAGGNGVAHARAI
jgi:hypothetical protein